MKPSLRLEGGAELEAALQNLEGATAKAVVRKALLKSLEPVEAAANASVPVRTGALKASIGVGWKLTRRQKRMNQPIAPVEAYVGPGVKTKYAGVAHAHLVEFGTVKMAPRPYMRPAWLANMQRVFDALGVLIWEQIAKRAKRNGG